MVKILGVLGSLRKPSFSSEMVRECFRHAEKLGAETKLLDLAQNVLPVYNPDTYTTDPAFLKVKELVLWADAYLLATPDYHGAMSGVLKNFLDFFWKEWAGRLFATVCASYEKGLTVHDEIRTCMRQCWAWTLPYAVSGNSGTDFDEKTGVIKGEQLKKDLACLAHDLVVYAPFLRKQFETDLASSNPAAGFAVQLRKNN